MTGTVATQVGVLARRSLLKTLRQPFQLFPLIFFPIILLAVNASGLKAATRLPGFPTHSYLSFAIAVAFVQGAMFALINSGTNLAEDIESGFFNRLALTPLRRVGLIGGLLLGVAALGAMQSAVYMLIGGVAGAHLDAGLSGALVILALGAITTVGFGALGCAAALRTGSGEAVQGLFPLF
ncbi:MAG TPA: ABC transporter permease, partial [Solirubrobacteraceae bacterium]|nr:ABC transporter permease [Solirubrobacteraceae bacterium]